MRRAREEETAAERAAREDAVAMRTRLRVLQAEIGAELGMPTRTVSRREAGKPPQSEEYWTRYRLAVQKIAGRRLAA